MRKSVTVNLTLPCLLASGLVAIGAPIFGYSLWWILLPFVLVAGLFFFFLFMLGVGWAIGVPLKITGPSGKVRQYRYFKRVG